MKYFDVIPGKIYRAKWYDQDWIFKVNSIEGGNVNHDVAVNVAYGSFYATGTFSANWNELREAYPEEISYWEEAKKAGKFIKFEPEKYKSKNELNESYEIF